MKVPVKYLHALLDAITKKCDETKDRTGLINSARKIKGIDEDYLYKNIYDVIKRKKPTETIGLRNLQVNILLKFIDHETLSDFIAFTDQPIQPLLNSSTGVYYSYLRSNIDGGAIFRSPAKIHLDRGKIGFELRGPFRTYKGRVEIAHGCLFILMKEDGGKSFHHVYKIGTRSRPDVLLGIFSGVSTAFDPIGGRAVLVRTDDDYIKMTNDKLKIKELSKKGSGLEKKLARYFKEESENNLNIGMVKSFGEDDLV